MRIRLEMKWVNKIKKALIKDKEIKTQKNTSEPTSSSQIKEQNRQLNSKKKIPQYTFENYRKLKVYKRPVINDVNEREQLFHKISEELNNID